jgi:beta-lactamase class A
MPDRYQHDARAGHVATRALTAILLGASLLGVAGCGATPTQDGSSTVAKAVPAPALPATTQHDPAGGVPDSPRHRARGRSELPGSQHHHGSRRRRKARAGPDHRGRADLRSHRRRRTGGAGSILSAADRQSFDRLAASLGGTSGVAVSGLGLGRRVERAGSLRSAVAWSTAKVPVAVAVIAAGNQAAQQSNLQSAITASDNAAALRLWSSLGGGHAAASAADEQLRAAGDTRTRIESRALRGGGYTPFGQTAWALTDQARFTAGLACTQAGAQVLGLMNQVVSGQRWGLGSAGVQAQLKGGWGPGSQPGSSGGYLDRQMGVLTISRRPLAVAIATQPADGLHDAGTRNLTAIARWIVTHADTRRLPGQPTGC